MKIYNITIEHEKNPRGVPVSGLRFSWMATFEQTAFSLTVFHREKKVYQSEKIDGNSNFYILPATLESGLDYTAEITLYSDEMEISGTTDFTTNIDGKFISKWIKSPRLIDGFAYYFVNDFSIKGVVKRATAYAVGLGYGIFYVNGERLTEELETPVSNYEAEILYRDYDITNLLKENNRVGFHIGEGWYAQSRVWENREYRYGDICANCQIVVEYEDGTIDTFITDESWKWRFSPVVLCNVYAGETYDARLEVPDWCEYGKNEGWESVIIDDSAKGKLKCAVMPPCRVVRTIKPIGITEVGGPGGTGVWVFDMGENIAGYVKINLPVCPPGTEYVLRFAETVHEDGSLDMRSTGCGFNLVIQQDHYICKGYGKDTTWSPSFTYHGFRYVEMTGFYGPGGKQPDLDFMEACVVHTDLKKIGDFESSDHYFNDLYKIMMNSILTNYHSYPEDCPVRERCGWTGDAHIVSDMALLNLDMMSSYEKFLSDLRTTKEVHGDWMMISPGRRHCGPACPLWGCVQVVLPYNMYKYTGDKTILEKYYDLMVAWVERQIGRSHDFIDQSPEFGDWCPPTGNGSPRRMPPWQSATFMFYEISDKVAEVSRILGKDASRFEELAQNIKNTIISAFYDKEKHTYHYQGSDAVAYMLGIYPDGEKELLVQGMLNTIKEDRYMLHTGIYGNKYLIPALFESGNGSLAYKLLFGLDHPSFGTMLEQGATSLWESVEIKLIGMKSAVGSYNHPMHSGFAYSYYQHLAGIKPTKPGYEEFEITPYLIDEVDTLKVSHQSPRGTIGVEYEKNGEHVEFRVTVPSNTKCLFGLPGELKHELAPGEHTISLVI